MQKNKVLDEMETEQKLNVLKSERLQSMKNVELLSHLTKNKLDESGMKEIFFRYSSNKKNITVKELTDFLIDVLDSFDLPSVVPEKAVNNVFTEFALNVEQEQVVSFTEFKTFFLYFQKTPIEYLKDTVQKSFCVPMSELKNKGALLSFFVNKDWASENCENGIPTSSDFEGIEDELWGHFGRDDGPIAQIFLFFEKSNYRVDVLVIVGDEERLNDMQNIANSTEGLFLMDHKVKFEHYNLQRLPRTRKPQGQLSKLAANSILGLHEAYSGANQVAEDWELHEKAGRARSSLKNIIKDVDKTINFSGLARQVSTSAKNLKEQANQKVNKVDENMRISSTLTNIHKDISRQVDKLKENETVKSGLSFISGIYESAKKQIGGFKEETMDIVGSELQETRTPTQRNEVSFTMAQESSVIEDTENEISVVKENTENTENTENEISFTATEKEPLINKESK